ncbi:MAG TPA: phosphoadenylyl-sulfate reductase [Rhizomicrobium sp.]|nr:phosphoadenylyl-sulfate reductase [Rhizomicrobium sp.]
MNARENIAPADRLVALQQAARGRDAGGLLALALQAFPGRTAVISSFGAESAVLLHLVAAIDPDTPILFLNTGKLFGETLRYRDRLQHLLGLTDVRSIAPGGRELEATDPDGTLWSRDPNACCGVRKVRPLQKALAGFDAQITGRKRFQTQSRAAMPQVEYFEGRFRFNPLAEWGPDDLAAYMIRHGLPAHPLVQDGFSSIGCQPCTHRPVPGEDARSGRWPGLEKDECGIHLGQDIGLR